MKKYFILMLMVCMSQIIAAQTAAEVINSLKSVDGAQFHSVEHDLLVASIPLNMGRMPENVDKEAVMAAVDKVDKLDALMTPYLADLESEQVAYKLNDLKKSGYTVHAIAAQQFYVKTQDNTITEILAHIQQDKMHVFLLIYCHLTPEEAVSLGQMMGGFMH